MYCSYFVHHVLTDSPQEIRRPSTAPVELAEPPQPKSWYRQSTAHGPTTRQPSKPPKVTKSPMDLVRVSLCPVTTAHLFQGNIPHTGTSRTSAPPPGFLPHPFFSFPGVPGPGGFPGGLSGDRLGGPPGGPPVPPPEFYIAPVPHPPTLPLGTLPSTAAFQEMLELLRVSMKSILRSTRN